MRYISIFSGIEAASVAWEPLGWEPVAFAEIEKFPSAVLAERFPTVPNLGDVTQIEWGKVIAEHGAVDVLVGGSPCQSFSIAGNRDGLDGASGLMWEYVRAVQEIRPRWLVWENVPGALSSGPGKGKGKQAGEDFGCLLRSLDELGYGLCWRILDAQFFGVAQRRRRVFLVGCLGAEPPVEVLFERDGLRWDYNPSREEREILARAARIDAAQDSGGSLTAGFKWNQGADAGNIGYENEQAPTIIADWHNPAVLTDDVMPFDQTQITHPANKSKPDYGDPCGTLVRDARPPCVVLKTDHLEQNGRNHSVEITPTLDVASATPVICLQGTIIDRTEKSGPQGSGINDDVSFTLNTVDRHAVCFQQNQREEVRLVGGDGNVAGSLSASPGMKNTNYVLEKQDDCLTPWDVESRRIHKQDGVWPTLYGGEGGGHGYVMCMADTQSNTAIDDEMSGTLNARMFKDHPLVGYAKEGE